MSNLSELLPAGSSVKSADFVAQGTLASGVTVGLRSDGKVEAITGTSTDIGTKSAAIFSSTSYYGTSAYDINSDRYVIVFINSSGYPTAVVAQLTGTTFTFGTPVVWQSAGASYMNAIYHPDENKVVVFYMTQLGGADFSGTGIVGNVTAGSNSIAFGTAVSWMTKSNNAWSMAYDTTADRIVGHYYDNGNNNYLYGVVAAVSGTTITFGTPVVVRSVAYHSYGGTVYDAYRNKTIYVYAQDTDSQAYAGIGTVNAGSNSISYTTAQAVGNQQQRTQLTYDPVSYKTVDLYVVVGALATTKYRVITNSGTSLTFGAETAAFSESANIILYRQVYDVTNAHIVQPYVDNSDTTPGNFGIVYRTGTISGDTVTYSDKTDLGIASDFYGGADGLSCDQSNAKFVQPFRDATDSNYPKAVAFTAGATNVSSYIGITDQAISSAATGKVVCKGGAITNTGLIPEGSISFGSISSPASQGLFNSRMTYDSASNRIVLAYEDATNSNYGTAVVGTVSGTSVTWGTPVVFNSASTADGSIDVVYDPDSNKSIIAYRDKGNSGYGTAIVGTVSGTAISFGAESVFSTKSSYNINITYDTSQDKVLIVYLDGGDSYKGYMIVGTVNGGASTISFGSEVQFESGTVGGSALSVCYDASATKSLLVYRVGTADYAASITISGTTPSIGTKNNWANVGYRNTQSVYVASSSACVIVYNNASGNLPVSSNIVAINSGSGNVTVNSSNSAISSTSLNERALVYDTSSANLIYVYNSYPSGSNVLSSILGKISGTSITWSDTTVVNSTSYSGNAPFPSMAYDSTNNKSVIAWRAAADSQSLVATTNATTPLVIGSAYFVQDDGTISTTSSTTKAGTALSTTSLLLTG